MLSPTLLSLLLAAAPPSPADVLARVDAAAITRADVEERVRARAQAGRPQPAAEAVADLVDEALLAGEARRLGLDREPRVAAELETQRRRLATDAYLQALTATVKPSEEHLRALYHGTADSAALVLIKLETEQAARAAIARLAKGADIAVEAKGSLDPAGAARAGKTGLVTRAALPPELAAEVFRAKPGALVGPVQLKLGWAIARVEELKLGDDAGFAARREQILRFSREQTVAQAKAHLVEQLRAHAKITTDTAFLKALGSDSPLGKEQLEHVVATVNGKPIRFGEILPAVAQLFQYVRGHGSVNAIVGVVEQQIDARLLSDEAFGKGFDRSPSVTAVLAGVQRNILAGATVSRISTTGELADPVVRKLVGELRKKAAVRVEQDRVTALEARR